MVRYEMRLSLFVAAMLGLPWAGLMSAAEAPAIKERLPAEEAIRQALWKPVTLSYDSIPLRVVGEDLESKLSVPVRFDDNALKDAGVDREERLTFSISKVSAKAALFHLLHPLGLTAIIQHEAVLITSPSHAENCENLKTKVYDVADLTGSEAASDGDPADSSALAKVLRSCVQPETWCDNGGVGCLSNFSVPGIRVLVIDQTDEVHDNVEGLLAQFRALRAARATGIKTASVQSSAPTSLPLPRAVTPQISVREAAVRAALEKPLAVRIKGVPLPDAVSQLAKAAGVPIRVTKSKDFDASSKPITLDAAGRSLHAVLDELAASLFARWTFAGETLLILPGEEEDKLLIPRVYDVSDLPAFRDGHGKGVPDYKRMKELITETVWPASWLDNGGAGTIDDYERADIQGIVVSQTWRTHLEIEKLLAGLRLARGRALTAEDIKKLPLKSTASELVDDLPPRPVDNDPRRDAVVAANDEFALDLHRRLDGANRVFSPSSLSTAMAVIYGGARGKTAEEIAKTLHFSTEPANVASGYRSLLATLPAADHPGCTFTSANRVWGQEGYGFLRPFLETTRKQFGSDLVGVDFANSANLCGLINAWADKQTAGKIKKVVDPAMINPRMRFIVTNAVYFKGLWAEPFKTEETRTKPFIAADGQVAVSLMHKLGPCRYGEFGDVKVIEKPYRGREIAMVVLLPGSGPPALDTLEKSLTAAILNEWISHLATQQVELFLPRFKLDVTMPLNSTLTAMGMATLFDQKRADLSGINGGKEPLWLDWVLQRAYINVDEEGTEAAAITGMGGMGGMMEEPKIKIFRADHPFLFLIRDTRTGCILFMGRLAKPAAN